MSGTMTKLYRAYVKLISNLQSPFLPVIRLYWGWQFLLTGKGKLLNLDRTAGFFANLHIPMPKLNAILAGSTECFGGLLLLRLVQPPVRNCRQNNPTM